MNERCIAIRDFLLLCLKNRVSGEQRDWLEKTLRLTRTESSADFILGYYTAASRKIGKTLLELSAQEQNEIEAIDSDLRLSLWGRDDAFRILILLSARSLNSDGYERLVLESYRYGDMGEQESWLKGLPCLPEPERYRELAIDACRTNIVPLLEAIACRNPYPSRYFPELNFNQLVLKCLFVGVEIHRIVGLSKRFNAELSRMCNDYIDEREAAGRSVPCEIWLALLPECSQERIPRALSYLRHEGAGHRYWVIAGLAHREDESSRSVILRHREAERDPRIIALIEHALSGKVDHENL